MKSYRTYINISSRFGAIAITHSHTYKVRCFLVCPYACMGSISGPEKKEKCHAILQPVKFGVLAAIRP